MKKYIILAICIGVLSSSIFVYAQSLVEYRREDFSKKIEELQKAINIDTDNFKVQKATRQHNLDYLNAIIQ